MRNDEPLEVTGEFPCNHFSLLRMRSVIANVYTVDYFPGGAKDNKVNLEITQCANGCYDIVLDKDVFTRQDAREACRRLSKVTGEAYGELLFDEDIEHSSRVC